MRRGQNVIAHQSNIGVLEIRLFEELDQPKSEIARSAHIVDHHQVGPVLARIGQQHRLAGDRQEQHRVPHAAIALGENRRREGRKMPAEIGQIARAVVERAPDHQQRVIPGGGCQLTRALLPAPDLLGGNRFDLCQCVAPGNIVESLRRLIPALRRSATLPWLWYAGEREGVLAQGFNLGVLCAAPPLSC